MLSHLVIAKRYLPLRCPVLIDKLKSLLSNASTIGLLLVVLLFTSACDRADSVSPPAKESPSPDVSLSGEEFQLQPPLVLDNIRFDHISAEDGISQNNTITILQDSDGFMWFGSEDGLNKYDGQNFTIYRHDPDDPNSLSDNWISAVHEDHLGALWIGTLNGGLNQYDRELNQFSHFTHDPNDPQSLSNTEVTAIYEDSGGVLWVGTRGGLEHFDRETGTFIHYQNNPKDAQSVSANAVLSIYETQDGTLWVGTEGGGLNIFDHKTETFTHFSHDPDNPNSLSHDNVRKIYEDQYGVLWIATDDGLDRFERESGLFGHFRMNPDDPQSLSHNAVRAIYEDPSGWLWIGTDGGGVNRLDREKETFTHYQNDPSDPYSLSHNFVNEIYQDREGVLWIGVKGEGLNKLFLGGMNFATFSYNPNDPNSLSNNNIRGIYEDQAGMLWVGTNGGLNRFDRSQGQWHHYEHDPDDPFSLSSNFVGDVYADRSGVLWVGTFENGLNKFDPETERFNRYQDGDPTNFKGSTVTEILHDQYGILWVGTLEGGLNRYVQEKDIFVQYQPDPDDPNSINSNAIVSLFEDQSGTLWIGSFNDGLNKFDRENETFTHFHADSNNSSSLSHNLVLAIYEDQAGTLWIGTGGGLNKFDPQTEIFKNYRKKDGLVSDLIYGILEDEQGNLWLSTNHGLSRFNPRTEVFQNFDVNDGLQNNEFNSFAYLKSKSGEMFFGGISGLNAFYPDQIPENNPFIPPVVLTSFTQSGEKLDLELSINSVKDIRFNWPNNFFEFEFSALSYAHPKKNQYAYMLEGFDDNWNFTGTLGNGRYTNLPGGTYTLRLIGSNNDGVWNETGHALEITVVPPVWQTWWFRGVIVLLLAGVAFFGYRQRIRNIESRSRDLEMQVEDRTAELQREIAQRTQIEQALRHSEMEKAVAAERSRLARDLHDSVTQSLYSLTLFTEAARHMAEEDGNETIEQYIGQIGVIGLQALKEMRLLVFELRPPELEKEGLVSALRRRLEAVEGRAGVDARVVVDELFKLPGIFEQELFRIAQEALNNALKHAAAASVVVYLRQENGSIEMEIVDDGVGFDPQFLPDRGGMGLKNIRERVEQLSGTVAIQSKPGDGTSIKITIENLDNVE
ncbi:two-component regulator propeller domain-containing protein [Chloroflexota bacterium]